MSSSNDISFWGTLGTGIAIGIVGSTFSTLTDELLNVKMGYSHVSFKNRFKITFPSGATTLAVVYGINKIDKQIKKMDS